MCSSEAKQEICSLFPISRQMLSHFQEISSHHTQLFLGETKDITPNPIPLSLLQLLFLGMTSCHMEYPFGQFRSAILAVSPLTFLCISCAEKYKKGKSLTYCKHCSVIAKRAILLPPLFSSNIENT